MFYTVWISSNVIVKMVYWTVMLFFFVTIANGIPRGRNHPARNSIKLFKLTGSNEKSYRCVCPGIQKPLCSYNMFGEIKEYPNLCFAKCTSAENEDGIGVIPGSMCKEIRKNNGTLKNTSDPTFEKIWFEEMEKETNFYKEIDQIMTTYLKAAGGPDGETCICPPIYRPVRMFGQSRSIITFDNICTAKCKTRTDKFLGISIFPWKLYDKKNPNLTFERDAEENFDYYLTKWKADMKNEIQFYLRVYKVMSPLA